jgi:hypothetical protein
MRPWIALLSAAPLGGCATVSTSPASGPVPDGVRVFPPKVLLMVDAEYDGGRGRTSIVLVPDLGRAYDVRPVTVLAKNNFRIDVEDGILKSLESGQDTTAFLGLLKSAGETAAKAPGAGVTARDLEGSYGMATGIYVLRPNGTFTAMGKPR